jgi:hypothetical protein
LCPETITNSRPPFSGHAMVSFRTTHRQPAYMHHAILISLPHPRPPSSPRSNRDKRLPPRISRPRAEKTRRPVRSRRDGQAGQRRWSVSTTLSGFVDKTSHLVICFITRLQCYFPPNCAREREREETEQQRNRETDVAEARDGVNHPSLSGFQSEAE